MLKEFIRDESGIAMGLAIVTIVLIGVMGAGLLVFVRNDLEAVVEVNQGQKAFDIADSGVQVAKRQLLSDSVRQHYDGVSTNDCASGQRLGADWSVSATGSNSDCSNTSISKPAGTGVTRSFAGGRFTVTIQCFDQTGDTTDVCAGVSENAPEPVEASKKTFFKVTSTGYYPADGSGAKRKVEAIFNTYDLGVPKAYFTPNNITLSGNPNINGVSLFAGGNVSLGGSATLTGVDQVYGDWNRPPYNTTARPSVPTCPAPDGTVGPCAGIGAVGQISGSSSIGTRDFDGTDVTADGPEFVADPSDPQNSDEITFPFDDEAQTIGGQEDQDRLNFLREEAKANGVYRTSSGGVVDVGTDFPWPANATDRTVVFVEYTSAGGTNRVDWNVGSSSDPPVKGTLVVNGGNFRLSQHQACLAGVVIVRGGVYEDGDSVDAGGNTCLDGFVNASGDIDIKGTVDPISSAGVLNRPGFYGVQQWSWRELYQ